MKIKLVCYTGTIESFNQMVEDLELSGYTDDYIFLDEKFNQCSRFTGIVKIGDLIMRAGDHYTVKLKDEHDSDIPVLQQGAGKTNEVEFQ